MDERGGLAQSFEKNRTHLRGVAYRMLGSVSEADDAVQEAWLRLDRSDAGEVENLRGWLTTVVARVCLDILRARKARREEALDAKPAEPVATGRAGANPEQEAAMAESVGVALLVVLDLLTPAERLAFVLHDLFGASFDDIATVIGRSPVAARQLASRARRRVRGAPAARRAALDRERPVVEAFLEALRAGDVNALLDVLDPDLVVHADAATAVGGAAVELHGAETWARGAVAYARAARATHMALVDGRVGLIWAVRGRLHRALRPTVANGRITHLDVIGDPARLARLSVAVIDV